MEILNFFVDFMLSFPVPEELIGAAGTAAIFIFLGIVLHNRRFML